MQTTKILLAEDDENLGDVLKNYLRVKMFETDWYDNGKLAFDGFRKGHYDLCLIDVMMPIKDGFTLAKEIRTIDKSVPLLFLTARSMREDILEGFKIGGDDYITKPFDMEELLFRIEAILRRVKNGNQFTPHYYTLGKYTFDVQKQLLQHGEIVHKLTTKESELLKMLCENANQLLERNYALKTIWADDNMWVARSMDVYITKLRKYLKDEPEIEIINVHGRGFKLVI
ncbi:MAG: response regulator transcription factor [Bacteroidales bacterium]|jgi:DNA-binding response OmpR family regulator|nr:response regulator transcription factor [Bacteroidales bacterium]